MLKESGMVFESVTISLQEYRDLIVAKAKVEALVAYIKTDSYVSKETALAILGEGAVECAIEE